MTVYQLSPSDLTFLWDSCKLCFYLKVKHNIKYGGVFPSMFGKMADLTSRYYMGKPASELSPDLPHGSIVYREKWVKSAPIAVCEGAHRIIIRGRLDAVVLFEDGSYGVIDYKTSEATGEKAAFYSRQLSAYAYALENPAPGAFSLSPISRLGLFVVTPASYERLPEGKAAFITECTWVEVSRDDAAFFALLDEVVAVLESSSLPAASETCELCNYRKEMQAFNRL